MNIFKEPFLNVIFRGGTCGTLGFVPNNFQGHKWSFEVIAYGFLLVGIICNAMIRVIDPKVQ